MAIQTPSPGQFIFGLAIGAAIGGFVAMPIAVLAMSLIFNSLHVSPAYAFIVIYVIGGGLGAWGLWRSRKAVDFVNGFVIGSAAGLLGLAALCNVLLGGLGNMH